MKRYDVRGTIKYGFTTTQVRQKPKGEWVRHEEAAKEIDALQEALKQALEYIDAIPSDMAEKFPAMPGFDRDSVDALLM